MTSKFVEENADSFVDSAARAQLSACAATYTTHNTDANHGLLPFQTAFVASCIAHVSQGISSSRRAQGLIQATQRDCLGALVAR